jgi:hypothetical protein
MCSLPRMIEGVARCRKVAHTPHGQGRSLRHCATCATPLIGWPGGGGARPGENGGA